MSNTVVLAENALDPTTWVTVNDVEDLSAFLAARYDRFPDSGRIYHRNVAVNCDVTPRTESDIDKLEHLTGTFFVVIYPEGFDPITIGIIIGVILALAIGASFLLRNSAHPDTSASPNNSLAARSNTSRPNERIPDIVGTVRAVPDLIALSYRVFLSNQEIEYSFMCIGRGTYQVTQEAELTGSVFGSTVYDVKEDQTFVEQIDGESVEIYGPNTSPNSGDAPQLRLGPAINTPVYNIMRSSSIVGQILRAPNDQSVNGNNNIRAISDGTINTNNTDTDFTAYFAIGDQLTLNFSGASDPGGVQPNIDLSGTYTVLAVATASLTLANPTAVNAAWSSLGAFTGGATNFQSPTLVASGSRVIGPFVLDVANLTEVWCNFVAESGLFKVSSSSGNQYQINDDIRVTVQALDENYAPVGDSVSQTCTVVGSAIIQTQRATTIKFILPLRTDGKPAGRIQVSAVRLTTYDTTWLGTNADQIIWRDLYAISPLATTHFGDVTTVQTAAYATASAATSTARKFNLEVTRCIVTRDPVTLVPTELLPTENAADIICALALDPYVGNRTIAELNLASIYATLGVGQQLDTYFGTDLCSKFCYTFDDSTVTFEESMTDIGQACFCQPFRRGSQLQMFFEQQTAVSSLLFNHRNKLPGSETRTATFGLTSDYDGINLDFIDPNALNYPELETTVTLYFPPGPSGVTSQGAAVNPRKIKTVGVRNNVQATILGWRMYQRLLYQNTATEFRGTSESALVINTQRILVADNTRPDTQDGEIVEQLGLLLTLSQPVTFVTNQFYVIFLQHTDGTVENIPITAVVGQPYQVLLQRAPLLPLVTDKTMYAPTTYQIAGPPNITYRSTNIVLSSVANISGGSTTYSGVIACSQDFSDVQPGESVTLVGIVAVDPAAIIDSVDVSGTYTVVSAGPNRLEVNANWSFTFTFEGSTSVATSGRVLVNRPQNNLATPFLLTSKKPEDNMIFTMQAINSDDRYYSHDTDVIDGLLGLNASGGGSNAGLSSGGSSSSGGGAIVVFAVTGYSASAVSPGGESTLLVNVKPGTGSTGVGVIVNLSAIGGSPTQSMAAGLSQPNYTPFTFNATVPAGTALGAYNLPFTAMDAESHAVSGTLSVVVQSGVTDALLELLTTQDGTRFSSNGWRIVNGGTGYTSTSTLAIEGSDSIAPYGDKSISCTLTLDVNGAIVGISGGNGEQWYGPPTAVLQR